MKDHKKVERLVQSDITYMDSIPLETFLEELEEQSAGLIEPTINLSYDDLVIIGWRPMTDRELAQQEARRESARKAAARRKEKEEAKERELYEKLQAKYDTDH